MSFHIPMKNILLLRLLCLLLVSTCWMINGNTQTGLPSEGQVRQVLQDRNIDETILRQRLQTRGIDIDNVTPEQLPQLQAEIEAVVTEMEAEQNTTTTPAPTSAPAVQVDNSSSTPEENAAEKQMPTASNSTPATSGEIYGHQLFRNNTLKVYRTTDRITPPDTYRLATGDEVAVSIFGASQADLKLVIDAEGFVSPPRMPKMLLRGLSLQEARKLLQARFRSFYVFQPGQISINLGVARTVTVNIFGETAINGTFTISALNSAFNALVAAGGPNANGSLRNIKLIRSAEEQAVDVYTFLDDPTVQADLQLQDNDVLFVPLADKVVTIEGGVRRPMRYELKSEEGLLALLDFAGGFAPRAYRELIQITRYVDQQEVILDVNLNNLEAAGQDFALQDDDRVLVRLVEAPRAAYVTIEGAVTLPGDYSWQRGMTVDDLLELGQLLPNARRDFAFLLRSKSDGNQQLTQLDLAAILAGEENPLLQERDRLLLYTQQRFTDQSVFSVNGAVRDPLDDYPYPVDQSLRLTDALLLAGGVLPNASPTAFLIRTDPQNPLQRTYIQVDIAAATNNPTSAENIVLAPLDQLVVYGTERYTDEQTVRISGAVREPGQFPYSPDLTLGEWLVLAGGLEVSAALDRIEVYRVPQPGDVSNDQMALSLAINERYEIVSGAPVDFQLSPFDLIIVRNLEDYELQQSVRLEGEIRFPGEYVLISENERITDVLERAGGLTAEGFAPGATLFRQEEEIGYIVIELDALMQSPNQSSNLTLKAGDVISVPKQQSLVTIINRATEVAENYTGPNVEDGDIVVAYQGPKNGKWYVDNYAAGFDEEARRRSLTVQYPNGEIQQTKKILFFNRYPKVKPGSIVAVNFKPQKPPRKERRRSEVDWQQTLAQSIAGITSVVTLILLIERI